MIPAVLTSRLGIARTGAVGALVMSLTVGIVLDVAKDEVRIGEESNLVRLTKKAWNTLVEEIHAGELSKL